MSGTTYTISAYVAGLGLMLIYGLKLWLQGRTVCQRRKSEGEK